MSLRTKFADMSLMKTLFTAAEQEAARTGEGPPAAEHLLLAALALPDDSGRRALGTFDRTADDVRNAIGAVHADALRSVGVEAGPDGRGSVSTPAPPSRGPYRSTGSLQVAFQRAVELSKRDGASGIRAAHLVIAVAEPEHGTTARVMEHLGVDRAALITAASEALTAG
ncbi:Clp protease N-terminal domain-containing protein [Cryptosporangium aurantiacum]|uniref:Clp amino terminal domain-containing protein, pathogenicity island component n=1 Tax=Cryptosporangium aurantiacum TaxID=134849 RepID=A0A1M7RLR4_9ACTN|nr:Clp protease N-terminal domain-containing protein [Cryptosporangium aurantiacum]SHN47253.1 Clp amino terminal domain-containing protein, pathogenicity island component [Cryptosporangium aurantiacum]